MGYVEIDDVSQTDKIQELNRILKSEPVYLLVYMEGCGPCNATRPEWAKFGKNSKMANKHVYVVINTAFDSLVGAGNEPAGFPTMRLVRAGNVDEYEGSRDAAGLIAWAETFQLNSMHGGSKRRKTKHRRHRFMRQRSSRHQKRTSARSKRHSKRKRRH